MADCSNHKSAPVRVSLFFLLSSAFCLLPSAFCLLSSALSPLPSVPQDHKNTSHVRQYPHIDELVTHADALTEKGRYEAVLELYAAAMKKFPEAVVPIDLSDREARRR